MSERERLEEDFWHAVSRVGTLPLAQNALEALLAEVWDEGWRAAQEVVELDGRKVWAHAVFPEGYEGNPYRSPDGSE